MSGPSRTVLLPTPLPLISGLGEWAAVWKGRRAMS